MTEGDLWRTRLMRAFAALNIAGQLGVPGPGPRLGAQLAEKHTGQQPGIACRHRARLLRREDDVVPGLAQQPPRHRDLSHVEVSIGQRDQYTHQTIIAKPARTASLDEPADRARLPSKPGHIESLLLAHG